MQGEVQPTPPRSSAVATRKFRILIVDDDRDSVDLIIEWLTMGGYVVTSARDGQEALRRIQTDRPDQGLLTLTVTDERTNLLNDRYLRRRLSEEFKRAQRYGSPLSVAMLDLDHFKQVNDRYGHDCGDQVLREFGKLLTENARTTDIVGRYGGEGRPRGRPPPQRDLPPRLPGRAPAAAGEHACS